MNIIKTIVLAVMLMAITSIAYLNNLHTTVNNDNNENIVCDEVYYHPTYTFMKSKRNEPSQGLYWITMDKKVISSLLIMPGMSISLTDSGNQYYILEYNGNNGQSMTTQDVEYLKQEIPELEKDGDSVIATDFYGYDNEQLIKIPSDQMLGQASGCKENNDKN